MCTLCAPPVDPGFLRFRFVLVRLGINTLSGMLLQHIVRSHHGQHALAGPCARKLVGEQACDHFANTVAVLQALDLVRAKIAKFPDKCWKVRHQHMQIESLSGLPHG